MYNLNPPEENQRTPRFAFIAMGGLVLATIALVIFIGLKQPDNSTHTASLEFVEVTQEVAPNQDIVIGVNNATLYVPKGATTMPGVISITPREPNLFSNVAEKGWVRSPVVNVEYWNGQGTPYPQVSFTISAEICFKITSELWQAYTLHPDEFQVHYYAEYLDPPLWKPLPLVAYPDRLQLCGQTDHLSIFALALKPQKEIPITGGGVGTLTLTPSQIPYKAQSSDEDTPVATPVSTQAALTATSVALTATDVPPSNTPVPNTAIPTTVVPHTAVPDTAVPPDTALPDTAVPDTPVPDTPVPDTAVPDTPVPNTPVPETPVPTEPQIGSQLSPFQHWMLQLGFHWNLQWLSS